MLLYGSLMAEEGYCVMALYPTLTRQAKTDGYSRSITRSEKWVLYTTHLLIQLARKMSPIGYSLQYH